MSNTQTALYRAVGNAVYRPDGRTMAMTMHALKYDLKNTSCQEAESAAAEAQRIVVALNDKARWEPLLAAARALVKEYDQIYDGEEYARLSPDFVTALMHAIGDDMPDWVDVT